MRGNHNAPSEASASTAGSEKHVFEWDLASLFAEEHKGGGVCNSFALLILNQPVSRTVLKLVWAQAWLTVAADGGGNRFLEAGGNGNPLYRSKPLDVIIGDLDSLTSASRHAFSQIFPDTDIIRVPNQDSTDFSKAVAYIRDRSSAGKEDMVVLGGLGGRVDQALGQLHHLYLFQQSPTYDEGRIYLLGDGGVTFLLQPGRHRIRVRRPGAVGHGDSLLLHPLGKHVGIIPIGVESSRITTNGLVWDVTDWETRFGDQVSTSNHVSLGAEFVEVKTTRAVLFTIEIMLGENG